MISRIEEMHLLQLRYKVLQEEMNKLNLRRIHNLDNQVYEGIFWISKKNLSTVREICDKLNSDGKLFLYNIYKNCTK